MTPEQVKICEQNGYVKARIVGDRLCALRRFFTTWAIVVGIEEMTYQRRYCYEHYLDAATALNAWDGVAHPTGPWIKLKGTYQGQIVDMLNPDLKGEPDYEW